MDTALSRAADRRRIAQDILVDLQLIERWQAFGKPIVVGAVAYGLVVAPDIDLEIFCDEPTIRAGFTVLQDCALHPRVHKARFANELDGPDQGYYWQLRYRHANGQEWKIDMWSIRHSHPGPCSATLVEPMKQALTDATRQTILEIKEQMLLEATLQCASIHIYRAVLSDGIRNVDELRMWLEHNPATGLVTWMPQTSARSSPKRGSACPD